MTVERSTRAVNRQESARLAAAFLPPPSLGRRLTGWIASAWPQLAALLGFDDRERGQRSGIVVCRFKAAVNLFRLETAGLDTVFQSPVIEGLVYCRASRHPIRFAVRRLRAECHYLFPETLHASRTIATVPIDPGPQWHHTVLETFASWTSSAEGAGTTVAVIDSSFDLTVEHLKNRVSAGAYWESTTDRFVFESDPAKFPCDTVNTHGTACAALAVGENLAGYGTGVAPRSTFVPIAIGDPNAVDSQSRLAIAVGLAVDPVKHTFGASPARVISCSVAPGQTATGAVVMEPDLQDALDLAEANDVLVVWAVANVSTAKVSDDEPANHAAVLNVGSVNDGLAGQGAEPPTVVAAVGGSFAAVASGPVWLEVKNSSSFAAPLVAGVAALVWAKSPKRSASDVRSYILGVKTVITSKVPLANADESVAQA